MTGAGPTEAPISETGMSEATKAGLGLKRAAGQPRARNLRGRGAPGPVDFDVVEREALFNSGAFRLAGTLALPRSRKGPFPAALLLVGSGPVDRDENYGLLRIDATRQIAGVLASAGIASLRYDKRGVGNSQGGDWRAAGFFDAVDDAAAALAFLVGLPEVDGGRVGAIGHSEGAFMATALVGRGAPLAALACSLAARCLGARSGASRRSGSSRHCRSQFRRWYAYCGST